MSWTATLFRILRSEARLIRALRRITDRPLDVHLMVQHPEHYIAEFADAGANVFTFHPEATVHVQRHLADCPRARHARRPRAQPLDAARARGRGPRRFGRLLVMSVNPGFGGQSYLPGPRTSCAGREPSSTVAARGPRSRSTEGLPKKPSARPGAPAPILSSREPQSSATADPAQAVRDLLRRCTASV